MTNVVGTNSWPWHQYCEARGQQLDDQLDDVLTQVAASGLTAWEGGCTSPAQTDRLAGLLDKHGLVMPTMYAGARLHEPDWRKAVGEVLRQADLGRPIGVRIVVCNPDPIQWGGQQDKSDAELRRQAEAMRTLASELRSRGMTLAYHTHDAELRASARELHHMLATTRHSGVMLCLDAHWLYRGAGNSNVALLDVLDLYGDRVVSVHLRQSRGGVWSETLGPGDVELEAVAARLRTIGFAGPLMLEICAEEGTPRTMPPGEAHRLSREWIEATFDAARGG